MPVDCPGQMPRHMPNLFWRMPKETNWESRCSLPQNGHTACHWEPTALCVAHGWLRSGIHTLTDIFETDEYEAMLFVYALKVFNSINCQNIQVIFPFLAPMIINTYRMSSCLFIDAESIMSREGVTQGDPLAMAFYAIATILLIESFSNTRFRSGMLMMLQVLASYPVCVHGGPRSVNLAQHLNTF